METKHEFFPQTRPHPGETLAEKLDEMNLGPKEFALRTGKPEKTIIAVLNGKSAITPDMAVQFEQVTMIPANFWMNHQRNYDEFVARMKRKKDIAAAIPWAKKFPLAEMIRKGWLPPAKSMEEKTIELLNFFSFSNHSAWEEYYFKQQLKVAFRISLKKTVDPYTISAWLRKGEFQAAELQSEKYNAKAFKESLPELQQVMFNQRKDYFNIVQKICLRVGVKVVITPGINKVPISGSTRWIKDTPLIQLSDKYKNTEAFWFTFFHEVGHILLHGKKDIFLEKVEYSDKQQNQEEEADAFALNYVA
jgi:addiction module HigA family antidote